MLTVDDAIAYKKRLFALPGRATDKKSSGCNKLIQEGSARLLINGSQLSAEMGWSALEKPDKPAFEKTAAAEKNLSDNERTLLRLLGEKEKASVDQLSAQTQLTSTAIAMALLNLELMGHVHALPGKMYSLAV